jgi:VWFA-related protein
MVVMVFDFATMTREEQNRARRNAIEFVHGGMQPSDAVAVIAANNGKVSVKNDFTNDRAVLESVIQKLEAGDATGSGIGASSKLSDIHVAAKLLAAIPGKKTLMYFSGALAGPGANDPVELQRAIDAAKEANMAIYPQKVAGNR